MKKTLAIVSVLALMTAAPAFAQDVTGATDSTTQMVDQGMKMMDTNGDGEVSIDERAAASKSMFTAADTSADGKLSADEMVAMHMKDAAAMKMPANADQIATMVKAKVAMLDSDKDGQISLAEEEAGSKVMFTAADIDADGMLSKTEMTDAIAKHMSADH